VADGADRGEPVEAAGEFGQVFADAEPRQRRRDGAELAADLGGGVRLRVERVDVARPAEQVEEEDRLRGGRRRLRRSPNRTRRNTASGGE